MRQTSSYRHKTSSLFSASLFMAGKLPRLMATRTEIAKRPLTLPQEEVERIWEIHSTCSNRDETAEKAGVTIWTVRKALAQVPQEFHHSLLKQEALETMYVVLKVVQERVSKVKQDDVAWLWKLLDGLNKLYLGSSANAPKNAGNLQNIFIGGEEAARLKQTMDAVEGEVIDHSDA